MFQLYIKQGTGSLEHIHHARSKNADGNWLGMRYKKSDLQVHAMDYAQKETVKKIMRRRKKKKRKNNMLVIIGFFSLLSLVSKASYFYMNKPGLC